MMIFEPRSAASASGRMRPCVSEMMPTSMEISVSARRHPRQSLREFVQLPSTRQGGCFAPGRLLIAQWRQRCGLVHGCNRAINTQRVGLGCETACRQRLLETAIFAQKVSRTDRADAHGSRYPV